MSTMLLMGIAAIAAVVNGPGLGDDIFAGLAHIGGANALNLVLGGTLGIIVLALLFDPWGTVVVEAPLYEEAFITSDIDFGDGGGRRRECPWPGN